MFYRVKQLYGALTAKVTDEDYIFVEEYLDSKLTDLFKKLPTYEQRHCINVAQTIRDKFAHSLTDQNKRLLIMAGLLHDIGKMDTGLNPLTKSLAVVMDKISAKTARKYSGKISFLDGYYNHPIKGKEIMKQFDVSKELLFLIENHHNGQIIDHSLLNTLIKADQLN